MPHIKSYVRYRYACHQPLSSARRYQLSLVWLVQTTQHARSCSGHTLAVSEAQTLSLARLQARTR